MLIITFITSITIISNNINYNNIIYNNININIQTGSCTIEFLIMKESEVLSPLRSYLTQIRTTLAAKIVRVRGLMDEVGIGVSVSSLSFYWLELMHKEGEDPLNSHTEMGNTEIESTNTPSNSDKSNNLNESNKSNHSNSLKYCEKVNLNDYVKNTKKTGNDERPDGKKEGEEKLFELSFDLHFALKTMHNARKSSLLTGDDNLKDNNSDGNTFNNSSDCHPSNHIRILIENQYRKEINEEKEKKLHETTDEKINCEKNLTQKKSVLSSHSAFGGISVKNQEKMEEEKAELLLFTTIEELNLSNRWGVCGFQPGNPLKDFQSNGLLALKSLTEFLLRYENAASQLGEVFVLQRSKYCTYAQVAVQLSKFAADSLRLTPTPYTPLGAPLQYLAKQPSWLLLSEQNCYQEVFNLSMLTFDEAWRASTEERGTFPHVDTYEQCLLYVRETLDVIIAAVSTLLICLQLFFIYSLFHFSFLICRFSHSIPVFLSFLFFCLVVFFFPLLPFPLSFFLSLIFPHPLLPTQPLPYLPLPFSTFFIPSSFCLPPFEPNPAPSPLPFLYPSPFSSPTFPSLSSLLLLLCHI